MSEAGGAGYFLVDPRPIAAEAPYTYFPPGRAQLAAVAKDDLVQLVFEIVPPGEKWAAERMWVAVSAAGPDELVGTLETTPDEARFGRGEEVRFRRHHFIGIHWIDPASAPAADRRREYWDRCLVDDCVLDGSELVEFVYREAPDMQQEGDQHLDSGWRFRGRRGSESDEGMERALSYVALGGVLNRDNSWLHLIDAPIGSAFMRNFETGEYVED